MMDNNALQYDDVVCIYGDASSGGPQYNAFLLYERSLHPVSVSILGNHSTTYLHTGFSHPCTVALQIGNFIGN